MRKVGFIVFTLLIVRRSGKRPGSHQRERLFRILLLQHRPLFDRPRKHQWLGGLGGRQSDSLSRVRGRFRQPLWLAKLSGPLPGRRPRSSWRRFRLSRIQCHVTEHNFLFGPRVSFSVGKFRPFAEALFGAAHVDANNGVGSDTSFATALGGGLDYKIIRPVAWRFQGDYVQTRFFGATQNNVRLSTGIVFRF